MKRRNFLKFIPFAGLFTGGCAIPVVGNSPEEREHRWKLNHPSDASLHELPKPIEKELTFSINGFKVKASITTHILLQCWDDCGNMFWEHNSYNEFYKCIAEAHNGKDSNAGLDTKMVRFESKEPFLEKHIDNQWSNFTKQICEKLSDEKFVHNLLPLKRQISFVPPSVKLA